MRRHEGQGSDSKRSMLRRLWPQAGDAWIGVLALGIIAICCLTYSPPLARWVSELAGGNRYLALADGLLNPFRNRDLLVRSGLPIYDLKISRREYNMLQKVAQRAMKEGLLNDDLKVWANAKFIHEGEIYDVKVRLRGDFPVHWKGPKKSYRISFGKRRITDQHGTRDEPINFQGKHEINLIIPSDKLYALAPFLNGVMRDAGLVTPRDQFVILRINGVMHGVYYEIEHFDKPLLAAYHRPETTVFGQNNRCMLYGHITKGGRPGPTDAKHDLGSMRRQVDPEGDLGMRAMQVLIDHSLHPSPENFRRVRAVLDFEKYLRFRVMTTICNTNHAPFGSDNLKLYYDPSRGLLEPIPWDLLLGWMPNEPGTIDFFKNNGLDEIQRSTLLDPELRLQRNKILWSLVGDGGDSLMARYDAIHNRIRTLIWADVLTTPTHGRKMDAVRKELEHNIRRIYKVLEYSSVNLTYRLEANERAALEFACLNFSGIDLKEVQLADSLNFAGRYRLYEDSNDNRELDTYDRLVSECVASEGRLRLKLGEYLFPRVEYGAGLLGEPEQFWEYMDALASRRRFFLTGKLAPAQRHPLEWSAPRIHVTAANAVSSLPIPSVMLSQTNAVPDNAIGITAFDASDPWDIEAPERSLAEFLRAHQEFRASRARAGAVEIDGHVTLSRTVIVPKSVLLIVKPGADITLKPRVSVLCYGGLVSVGTPGQRIRIHGDGSGKAWDTFAAVRPPQEVVLRYTDFRGGGQAQVNGILFTGGFAVHDGDLRIEQCHFEDMQSEDAVNLKNGRITMRDCVFRDTASDAVDLDFVDGKVEANIFFDIAGDAVDLSGSTAIVSGNRFENIGDKGISVGEDSHPVVVNNFFNRCNIAISCKDLSSPKVTYCTLVNNEVAIEAKRKKAMFGGGSGEFAYCVFKGNKLLLDEDYFSRDQVSVKYSILDAQTSWPTCKTVPIRFVAPEVDDYRLAPESAEALALPLSPTQRNSGQAQEPTRAPGVFMNRLPRAEARSASHTPERSGAVVAGP